MTRLVACDIDGTLLDGSTAIAPAVFTQIRRLSRLGVYFCPASGRQYSSLQPAPPVRSGGRPVELPL